jgi:hypothetical protein
MIDDICNNAYNIAEKYIDRDIHVDNKIDNDNDVNVNYILDTLTNDELQEIESLLISPRDNDNGSDGDIDNIYQLVSVIMHKGSAHSG